MRRYWGWVLAGMLAFTFAPASGLWAEPLTTIRFKDRVEIDGDEVLLGQMAAVEGSDDQFNQRLKNIVIGKAPSPGDARQFDQHFLQQRLKQHHIDLTMLIVQAPPEVIVTRSHVKIKKKNFGLKKIYHWLKKINRI